MTKRFPRRAALIGALLVVVIGSAIGFVTQTGEGSWYQSLIRPAATPANWAFGVIWPILYVLIGAAGGIVWAAREHPGRRRALFWYLLQLALNFAWTPIFFGMEQIALGLGIILALNLAAIVATVRMGRVSRLSAWLMVPYLVWIAYAATLNFRIWQLNPALPTFA